MSQQREALRLANEVRYARAAHRAALNDGSEKLADLLREPPSCFRKLPIQKVLTWAPGIGVAKATMLVRREGLPVAISMAGVSRDKRERLASAVERIERTSGHARRHAAYTRNRLAA